MKTNPLLRLTHCSCSRRLSLVRSLPQSRLYPDPSLLSQNRRQHVRHMGIFQEFMKRVKGEIESNPELQKSIKDFKEKADNFKHRTKEATGQFYERVDATRVQAEARASQVSALVKEKVQEAKGKVVEASTQVKEKVEIWKLSASEHGRKPPESSTEHVAGDASTSGQEQAKGHQETSSFFSRLNKHLEIVSSPFSSAYEKVRRTKLLDLAKDGYDLVKGELTASSSKRLKTRRATPSNSPRSSSAALIPVVRKKTRWEKRWDNLKDKVRSHPVYKRFRGVKELPVLVRSQEIAEDLRERWETSDSPVVHKIQDLNDSIFGETATAMALKEIRQRDPTFSFPEFLAEVQESLRPVLQAYLKGDIQELEKRCSREVVDRCRAERKAYESQGIFFDNKILHISDVDLKETKLLGNVPIIIVAFQTQQVYCVRDCNGKITQGAKDEIHTVFYAWAMQQVSDENPQDGDYIPRWQLREMQQLGIQAII